MVSNDEDWFNLDLIDFVSIQHAKFSLQRFHVMWGWKKMRIREKRKKKEFNVRFNFLCHLQCWNKLMITKVACSTSILFYSLQHENDVRSNFLCQIIHQKRLMKHDELFTSNWIRVSCNHIKYDVYNSEHIAKLFSFRLALIGTSASILR